MMITSVSAIKNNYSFKATQNNPNADNATSSLNQDEKMLKAGLACLAVLGTAVVGYTVTKKMGKDPSKIVKKQINNIKEFFSEKPKPDPIFQKIGDRRDAEAVKMYKAYIAKEKMNSLHKKLLDGHFDGKPKSVFENLRRNERILRREASFVL